MTQKELLLAYIREFGSAIPAKMAGLSYRGGFFGSETSKRARELRKQGMLRSEPCGKFEKFFLTAEANRSQVGKPKSLAGILAEWKAKQPTTVQQRML